MKPRLKTAGLELCYSKCGLWTGNLSIAWEFLIGAGKGNLRPPPDDSSSSAESHAPSSVRSTGSVSCCPSCEDDWTSTSPGTDARSSLMESQKLTGPLNLSWGSVLHPIRLLAPSPSCRIPLIPAHLEVPACFSAGGARIWAAVLFGNERSADCFQPAPWDLVAWWPSPAGRVCPFLTLGVEGGVAAVGKSD